MSGPTGAHSMSSLRLRTPGEALSAAPIGVVPILWNNADLPDLAPPVSADDLLDEIARLGFDGMQLGVGFRAGDALRDALAGRGLRLAEAYVEVPCQAEGPAEAALEIGRARLAELHAAGGEVLVVALNRAPERDAWVGRSGEAPRLTERGWRALAATLEALASESLALGHPLAFHNHAGSYVEAEDEIDRLAASTDPQLVSLCLDVGHALVGAADPLAIIGRHGRRIIHLHLKDVAPDPLRALRDGRLTGFEAALRARIFAPLGSGMLDLPAVLDALARQRYEGWLMVEQDTSWEPASEAAAIGRRVLDAMLRWSISQPGSAA
ncbi:MAG TPA: sugar phosphate isomerase/epimerase [Candidatus Dormibacteraeota bacterium]|nr:sugar phosphate isomerase/epimerase [Candidatus Dormibacteraeota bacterium]